MSEAGFAERLKRYRRERGMTQQELADALGVSNKTISRWESGGGYPDVALLVPLARALNVTVDDLLNEEKPVRTLTKEDWQNLLPFVFAIGGGLLFFLLNGPVPAVVCYLLYLACLGYGVYLQKYYAFRSGWFLLSAMVVNFFVNIEVAVELWVLLTVLAWMGQFGSLNMEWDAAELLNGMNGGSLLVLLAVAAALTAVTYIVIRKKGGLTGTDRPLDACPYRLCWRKPTFRRWLPALFPPAIVASLLAGVSQPVQSAAFFGLIAAAAVVCVLLYRKKGERLRLIPAGVMMALCIPLHGTVLYFSRSNVTGELYPGIYDPEFFQLMIRPSWGTWTGALAIAAAWIVVSCLQVEKKERPL